MLAPSSSSPWSPPEGRRYNFRKRPKRVRSKMSRDHANWSREATKVLLNLCMAEKEKLNFNNQGPTREGWRNICRGLKEANIHFDRRQVTNKLSALHKAMTTWRSNQKKTGLGRNPRTGPVEAEADSLGDMHSFSDEAEDPSPSQGPPPTVPVTSPRKQADVGKYLSSISNSIARRTSSGLSREQQEQSEVMNILREDGVEEGTELYFMALDLFQKKACRAQFRNIAEKENRIKWIDWTWKNSKNNPK